MKDEPELLLDARDRRKRRGPRQLNPKLDSYKLRLGERDYAWFWLLQTFGRLPSNYQMEHTGGSQKVVATRLAQLWRHGWLDRTEKQWSADNSKGQPLTTELTDKALEWLEVYGERVGVPRHRYPITLSGHQMHQFALSCMVASIYFAARRDGARFITPQEIFSDPRCTNKSLTITTPEGQITLDWLYGIEKNGVTMFYNPEVERTRNGTPAIKEKWRPFDAFHYNKLYKEAWGIPNLRTQVFTYSRASVEKHMDVITNLASHDRFMFRSNPFMYADWEVPPVMYELYTDPWQTTGEPWLLRRP